PEALVPVVRLGTMVRVPLRGRRVRGWVVATSAWPEGAEEAGGAGGAERDEGIQPIAAVSGPAPVFDGVLLATARTMARRYVHPLSAFLRLMTPPQVGRRAKGVLAEVPAPSRDARRGRTLRRLGPRDDP